MIAPARARRPGAAQGQLEPPTEQELADCPFCEGREDRTPPETLALPAREPRDSPGWRVRVVPNLYPAFEHQEVVIHGPEHLRAFADLPPDVLELVAEAWTKRAEAARADGYAYVHALVNEGRPAGASLPHSHSQLVWMRERPPLVEAELPRLAAPACALCRLLDEELAEGTRVVAERDGLALVTAYAGRAPYELVAAPLEHRPDGLADPALLSRGLSLLAEAVRRLRGIEGPVPWNAWLHAEEHWHVEIVPRLTVFAGVELGGGIYVNSLAPEEAARALRDATVG